MLYRFLAWVRQPRPPRSPFRPWPVARTLRGVAFSALVALLLLLTGEAAPEPPSLAGLRELQAPAFTYEQRPTWEDPSGEESAVGGGDPFTVIQLQRSNLFAWPAAGMLTSYFGRGHPTGIDIALDNDRDTPIVAAADGIVSHAGGTTCCDYGLFVILEHEGGFSSLYAHQSKLSVKTGQFVKQGDQLGLGGDTGDATGKHLHFELLAAGSMVDPLRYLPSKQRGLASNEPPACGDAPVSIDAASQVTLSFGPPDSGIEIEELSLAPALAAAPRVETHNAGPQAVSLAVPPVAAATTRTYAYDLALTLKLGEERREVRCAMALTTMPTLTNPPDQIPLHAARTNAILALQAQQKVQQQTYAEYQYQQELWQYHQNMAAAAAAEATPTPDLNALLLQAQMLLQSQASAPPPQAPVFVPAPPTLSPTLPATATLTRTPTPSPSATATVAAQSTATATPTPTKTPTPAASPSATPGTPGAGSAQ